MNTQQKVRLVKFLSDNPKIFTYSLMQPDEKHQLWAALAQELNEMPGGKRKAWQDWRKTGHSILRDVRHRRLKRLAQLGETECHPVDTALKKVVKSTLRNPRSAAPLTKPQKLMLLTFVKNHPLLLFGSEKGRSRDLRNLEKEKLWREIADLVNGIPGGVQRTWFQWRRTLWNHIHKLKKNANAIRNRTGITRRTLRLMTGRALTAKQNYLTRKYDLGQRNVAAKEQIGNCLGDLLKMLDNFL